MFVFLAEAFAGRCHAAWAESCDEPDSAAMVWQRSAWVSV